MDQIIMVGCDLHDKTMVLKYARGQGKAESARFANSVAGRQKLLDWLRRVVAAAGPGGRAILAYEASGQGFTLYDELMAAGHTCYVVAPTKILRSSQQRKRKTDEQDADQLLQLLRGHVLAGIDLPSVWVPSLATRDDREIVRCRLDTAEKLTAIKTQVQSLLKLVGLRRTEDTGKGWTKGFVIWLRELSTGQKLAAGACATLASYLRQYEFLLQELDRLETELERLAANPRYAAAYEQLTRISGVGPVTALVFLTEFGDVTRFQNRRQVASYLGLVPACFESGERGDCKGHITRQGPSRVRKVLCQAAWSRVRCHEEEKAAYQRIVEKNPKHKKIATVASMRRLAVRMWHAAVAAQSPAEHTWERDQRPQFPLPDPHPLPSSRLPKPSVRTKR